MATILETLKNKKSKICTLVNDSIKCGHSDTSESDKLYYYDFTLRFIWIIYYVVHIHFCKLYLSKKLHNAICLGALVFMKACVKQTLCAQICTPNIWISTTMLLPSFYTSSLGKQIMLQQIFCSTSRLNKRLHSADVCWFCTFSIRWNFFCLFPLKMNENWK